MGGASDSGMKRTIIALAIAIIVFGSIAIAFTGIQKSVYGSSYIDYDVYRDVLSKVNAIEFHVSEKALNLKNITNTFRILGAKYTVHKSLEVIPTPQKPTLIIVHVDDIIKLSQEKALQHIKRVFNARNKAVLVITNPGKDAQKMRQAIDTLLRYYMSKNMAIVVPLNPNATGTTNLIDQLHPSVFKAQALAFTNDVFSMIMIDRLDMPDSMLFIIKFTRLINSIDAESRENINRIVGASSASVTNFDQIGGLGWYTATSKGAVCGEDTGKMEVYADFYQARQVSTGWWNYVVYVAHRAQGIRSSCTQCSLFGCTTSTHDHYPLYFVTAIDWLSRYYPGQEVTDYGPKPGAGCASAITISYTISSTGVVSASGGVGVGTASLAVQYSTTQGLTVSMPYAPSYFYCDYSWLSDGIVNISHKVVVPKNFSMSLSGVSFTVEVSSLARLRPDKPGGALPVLINGYFRTIFTEPSKENVVRDQASIGPIRFCITTSDIGYRCTK
jgi:hypothetical protein